MNLFTLISCGALTPDDDFAIVMQGVSPEHANQIGTLLALSNKDDAVFQYIGLDTLGDEGGRFTVTYEGALAELEERRVAARAKNRAG